MPSRLWDAVTKQRQQHVEKILAVERLLDRVLRLQQQQGTSTTPLSLPAKDQLAVDEAQRSSEELDKAARIVDDVRRVERMVAARETFIAQYRKANGVSVPTDLELLQAASKALLDTDVIKCGILLETILKAACASSRAARRANADGKDDAEVGGATVKERMTCVAHVYGDEFVDGFKQVYGLFRVMGGQDHHMSLDGGGGGGGYDQQPPPSQPRAEDVMMSALGAMASAATEAGGSDGGESGSGGGSTGGTKGGGGGGEGEVDEETAEIIRGIKPVPSTTRWEVNAGDVGPDDMVGAQAERELLVSKLVMPRLWKSLFRKTSNVMLYGMPGTGKSLIAKGLVYLFRQELPQDLPTQISIQLYEATGAELKSKYVGGTEKRIRVYYDHLQHLAATSPGNRKTSLSLFFLDEVETLAADRQSAASASGGGGSSVTSLLQALDGIRGRPKVVTIAATNIPWMIDTAVMRRFKTQVLVDLPSNLARYNIMLNVFLGGAVPESSKLRQLKRKPDKRHDEEVWIEREEYRLREARAQLRANKDVARVMAWLAHATGWRIHEALDQLYATFVANGDDIKRHGKSIAAFVHEGEHYPHQGLDHAVKTAFNGSKGVYNKELGVVELNRHSVRTLGPSALAKYADKLLAIKKDVDYLRKPRFVFGYSAAGVHTLMSQAINEYLVDAVVNGAVFGRHSLTGEPCLFRDSRSASLAQAVRDNPTMVGCDIGAKEQYVASVQTFMHGGPSLSEMVFKPEFIDTLVAKMKDFPSDLRPQEYANLVYYKIRNKKPTKTVGEMGEMLVGRKKATKPVEKEEKKAEDEGEEEE